MKRVLVTGAGGFIGRNAVEALLARGYEVHAVTSQPTRLPQASSSRVHVHGCDLLDREQARRLMEQVAPSHLLHLAWYTSHGNFWTSLENLRWVGASLSLLEHFARNGGKRVVFAGTCAEYEWKESVLSEASTPLCPATLYGTCKNALRAIVEMAARQEGLSAAWGRIFYLYGPFEDSRRLVASAIVSLLRKEPADFSHGRQIRDLMHVEDVARAFVHVLDSGFEGPINIASGDCVSLREVIETVGALLGRPDLLRIGARPSPSGEPAKLGADVTRLRRELGFEPGYSLEAGLRATIGWWEEHLRQGTKIKTPND